MKLKLVVAVVLIAGTAAAQTADRFRVLKADQLNPEQEKLLQALLSGPRGGGDFSQEAVNRIMSNGPFNAWMRSPDLGNRLQKVGEYLRYETLLPPRLKEFAILITAREWTSQFEWYAHLPVAIEAGLDPKTAADLAAGERPANMKEDEAAVYAFCTQLHRAKKVSDANYGHALRLFGERGVVDLIGISGYYTAVSMTLNVAEVPVPAGKENPLKPLRK